MQMAIESIVASILSSVILYVIGNAMSISIVFLERYQSQILNVVLSEES